VDVACDRRQGKTVLRGQRPVARQICEAFDESFIERAERNSAG
jgi:hypothetical protein